LQIVRAQKETKCELPLKENLRLQFSVPSKAQSHHHGQQNMLEDNNKWQKVTVTDITTFFFAALCLRIETNERGAEWVLVTTC